MGRAESEIVNAIDQSEAVARRMDGLLFSFFETQAHVVLQKGTCWFRLRYMCVGSGTGDCVGGTALCQTNCFGGHEPPL